MHIQKQTFALARRHFKNLKGFLLNRFFFGLPLCVITWFSLKHSWSYVLSRLHMLELFESSAATTLCCGICSNITSPVSPELLLRPYMTRKHFPYLLSCSLISQYYTVGRVSLGTPCQLLVDVKMKKRESPLI